MEVRALKGGGDLEDLERGERRHCIVYRAGVYGVVSTVTGLSGNCTL